MFILFYIVNLQNIISNVSMYNQKRFAESTNLALACHSGLISTHKGFHTQERT
jgi:hypothetical protein